MSFDVEAWMADLGMSEEEKAQQRKLLGLPERLQKLEGNQLRQQEFSKKLDAVRVEQETKAAELTAKQQELQDLIDQNLSWKDGGEKQIADARKRVQDLERDILARDQRLRQLATDYNVDISDIQPTKVETPPKKDEPTATDPNVVTRADLLNGVLGTARLSAQLQRLSNEHRKLFGEDLPDPEALITGLATAAKKDPNVSLQSVWETQFKVTEKRQALAEQAQKDHDEKLVRETEMRVRSELNLPAPRSAPGSPVLPLTKRPEAPAGGPGGVAGAVAAHAIHKYAPGTT